MVPSAPPTCYVESEVRGKAVAADIVHEVGNFTSGQRSNIHTLAGGVKSSRIIILYLQCIIIRALFM